MIKIHSELFELTCIHTSTDTHTEQKHNPMWQTCGMQPWG